METYDYGECSAGYELTCIWSSKYIRCICENMRGTNAALLLGNRSVLLLERL